MYPNWCSNVLPRSLFADLIWKPSFIHGIGFRFRYDNDFLILGIFVLIVFTLNALG